MNEDWLSGLNDQQKAAVLHSGGPALVLAGAGSGKTRVIVHRIARLIGEMGVRPSQILSMTFTNKAAQEMRTRAALMVDRSLRDMKMGTFHSFGSQLLREEAPCAGRDRSFTIYDQDDSEKLMKGVLKTLNTDLKRVPPRAILARIEAAKHEVLGPDDMGAVTGWELAELAPRAYKLYEAQLRKNNAFDFGDLIMHTVILLENDEGARGRWSSRFAHVMVDEYQDIDVAQYRILRCLAGEGENLFVVGDPDQSIYAWRGADVRNILEFQKDFPGAGVYRLEKNYRSYGNILKVADAVIHHNRKRLEKKLVPVREDGPKVVVLESYTDREEAEEIAERVRAALRDRGVVPAKADEGAKKASVAVLYRTNAQSRVLEEAFRNLGIPYEIIGGIRFYERREVKDILAYLSLAVNPKNDLAVRRVANVPPRALGEETMEALAEVGRKDGRSLLEILGDTVRERGSEGGRDRKQLSTRAAKGADEFVRLIARMKEVAETEDTAGALRFLLEASGYLDYLLKEGTDEAASRAENLKELVSGAQEFAERHGDPSPQAFLEHVSLVAGVDKMTGGAGVVLMTLHTAKGLEFDTVFLAGLEEGLLPHMSSMEDPWDLEEERRLMYVGVTRGKNQVVLSRAITRRLYGGSRANPPSRFLREIPKELLITAGEGEFPTQVGMKSAEAHDGPYPKKGWAKVEGSGLDTGDRVLHHRFGEGTVVSVIPAPGDSKIEVAFDDHGMRLLLASYAKLVKIKI